MKFSELILAAVGLLASTATYAQSLFLSASDSRLRDDVSLLVDEGVINLPVNEWPLARDDVAQAVKSVRQEEIYDSSLRLALGRVIAATTIAENAGDWELREIRLSAGQPGLLRADSTLGRENGELTSVGGAGTDRYSITVAATGVVDASDGQDLRLDGTEATVRWGNWLFSANQIDRWWGPGRDGSLILSTNARPMPAVSLDRYRSLPVNVPVLRLLGPWRFSGFLGLGEKHRADVDRPAFMGMRLSFKPAPIFEFGMSRTAQFCGKERVCGLKTLGRVLIGRDNPGYRGLNDPGKEPGNQMAGFDLRIVSPFKSLPIAVYAQEIGEDNSSSGIPERYLGLFGGESWLMMRSGSIVRARVEYSNTKVKWYNGTIEPDSAYRQGIFFAGYRYRGRNIGHTTDADSESTSIMLSLTTARSERWTLRVRRGHLDRIGVPDPYNSITFGPSRYAAEEFTWEGRLLGLDAGAQIGLEKQVARASGVRRDVFGLLQIRKKLN